MREEINLGSIQVLVVEDDRDAREMIKFALEECGARVDTSPSARNAWEQLKNTNYDVIVSDISMPDVNGYELIRELRARGIRTPAVAVTAYSRPEYESLAAQAGFNVQLAKPLDLRELSKVIEALVRPSPLV